MPARALASGTQWGTAAAEVVIVVDRATYLFISGIVTASILLFVALFWATCSPGRGMKVALAAAAACLVASTAWTFAALL